MNRVGSGTPRPWLTLTLTAAATSVIAVPVRQWLLTKGTVDVPNHRSSHAAPIPRGGGLAGVAGAAIASLVTHTHLAPRLAVAVAGVAALGWLDDVTGHVHTGLRLAGQLIAGSTATDVRGPLRVADPVLTAGIINVVNFMDGINGISGMTAAVWGVNAIVMPDHGSSQLAVVGALTAGAGLGFLPHNVPTAKLFLGDVGSYAMGTAMAVGILSQPTLSGRYQAGAPLLLYGVDAAQALVHRIRQGERLGGAHRDHVYQRLVDAGSPHYAVAAVHAGLAACIALLAAKGSPSRAATTVGICVLYVGLPRVSARRSVEAVTKRA